MRPRSPCDWSYHQQATKVFRWRRCGSSRPPILFGTRPDSPCTRPDAGQDASVREDTVCMNTGAARPFRARRFESLETLRVPAMDTPAVPVKTTELPRRSRVLATIGNLHVGRGER